MLIKTRFTQLLSVKMLLVRAFPVKAIYLKSLSGKVQAVRSASIKKALTGYRAMITLRFFLAFIGGYAIAAFAAKWMARLPLDNKASSAMGGTMLALLLYCAFVCWVFSVQSTRKALGGAGVVLAMMYVGYGLQVQ